MLRHQLTRSLAHLSFVLAAALLLFSPRLAEAGDPPADHHKKTVVETAVAGGFETLVAAVKAAGLVDALNGDGPFTIFAPTDEAFAKLPEGTLEMLLKPENKDKLQAILTYHVVPGSLTAAEVTSRDALETLQGAAVNVHATDKSVMIGDATVTKANVQASNGIIHVIDTVLLPPSDS